jgi:uncharacterized protein (TIGR00725 family)
MSASLARHTIGVLGSGRDEHDELAGPLGRLLAGMEVNLLTGGGGGVMRAVSRSFVAHRRGPGICIGILPCAGESDRASSPPGYPNEFVELAVRTHLPLSGGRGTDDLSRNHLNVLSSDALVALPGGEGTASEVSLALRYGRPVVVYAPDPASARLLPEPAPRAGTIEEVRRFLLGHL